MLTFRDRKGQGLVEYALILVLVAVVDSAHATAADVRAFLETRGLCRQSPGEAAAVQLLVTDVPRTFREVASRFLGDEVDEVEQVDL